MMVVLDSSCWLEYFLNGEHADTYAPLIEDSGEILVPAIVLHEVFKVVMRQRNEDDALSVAAVLQQFNVVPVDENIAMYAAKLAIAHQLAMADSMILATAIIHRATLWTQDADFHEIEHVRYIKKC